MVHDALGMLVVDEMVEGVTEAGGLGDHTLDGAEMNLSLMRSGADVDELVVVAILERGEAVVNKSMIPSRGNDEDLVLDVAVEAAMIVSVVVAVGENASLQLVVDSTGDDA